jgi:hypothetical protein
MQLALTDPEWNGFSGYPVKGRNGILIKQKLQFADYHTGIVDRSWTKGSSVTAGLTSGISTDNNYRKLITKEHIRRKQTLFFELKDSSGTIADVYCVSKFRGKDFNIGNSSVSFANILLDIAGIGDESSSFFYVQIYQNEGDTPWHLVLDNENAQRNPKTYRAKLTKNENEFYTIHPDAEIKNKKGKVGVMPFGSGGFQIRDKSGKAVAAVSMIDNGVVYLTNLPKEDRILLASACAALLLQEQI